MFSSSLVLVFKVLLGASHNKASYL